MPLFILSVFFPDYNTKKSSIKWTTNSSPYTAHFLNHLVPVKLLTLSVCVKHQYYESLSNSIINNAYDIAKKNGAECPFIRPFELSDDCSSTSEVINHSIDYLEDQKKEFNF